MLMQESGNKKKVKQIDTTKIQGKHLYKTFCGSTNLNFTPSELKSEFITN